MAGGGTLTQHVINTGIYHYRVHQGLMFSVEHFDVALAGAWSIEILLRTSAKGIHCLYNASLGGDASVSFFEEPTVTVAGTALTTINHNRNSSFATTTLAYHTPTTTDDGTPLDVLVMPGGTGGNAQGGTGSILLDWELKPSTDYLLRLTNLTGQVQVAHLHVNFYENERTPGAST